MKNIIIYSVLAIMLFLNISCAKKDETPPLVFDTSYTKTEPTIASNGKRVYLIHGSLKYSRAQWEHPVFKPFVDALTADGFEVITFDLPHFYPEYFHDGGANYRAKFENQLRTIVANVELDHGHLDNIVGGFSFGGLHSMMAQADMPDVFNAYFAILPVVEMTALTELKGMASSHFNPKNEVAVLETKRGLISWGTQDFRVNYQHSIDLVNLMDPTNLTAIEYVGLNHNTTPQVVADTLAFVQSL
jgi:alpha-beta hydrolase superfamily lysophospholipase